MSDEEKDLFLIKAIANQDEAVFEEFVKKYQSRIINLIYKYTHSRHDAEELAQDVFIKVWDSAPSFKARSKVLTWIYRIAINTSLNYIKRKSLNFSIKLGDRTKDLVAPQKNQPEFLLIRSEREVMIEKALENLHPSQKTAFILSKYQNYSYAKIAEIMKISIPAVESVLFRAKQKLREELLPLKEKGEF